MSGPRGIWQRIVAGGEIAAVSDAPWLTPRQVVTRFWPAVRPYRLPLAMTLVLAMAAPLLETLAISLFGRLVDDVLVPQDLDKLGPIAAAYIGLTLLGGVVSFGRSYLAAWVAEHLLFDLRNSLFRHVLTLSPTFFERARLGDTVSRLTDDVDELGEFLASGLADGVSHLLKIVFFAGALFYLDARLAALSLIVAPPFWFAARRFSSRVKSLAREQRARDGAVTALVEESLGNAPLVQAYNGQAAAWHDFARQTRSVQMAQLALERLRAGFAPLVDLIEMGGMLIVVAAGAFELTQGRITIGGLLAFFAYLSQLYGPVRGLSHLWGDAMTAAAAAERVSELEDLRPQVTTPAHPVPLPRAAGAIVFDIVSYRYPGGGHDALRQVSFQLAPGETLALVGRSGAGKSTVTRLLLRLDDPDFGRITLDGHDLRDLHLEELRRQVTVLPQESLFFDVPVREVIAYGRPGASAAEIAAAARAAGADEFIARMPDGYETRVGQRGRSLSGGQRQRLAIARALLRDAPVLVLDEPTTGLDRETATRLLASIRTLMAGRTTIVISHDLDLVRDATRILVIERGCVVETGDHASLMAADGPYARLWQTRGLSPELADDLSRDAVMAMTP